MLTPDQVFSQIRSPSYWQRLVPSLTVGQLPTLTVESSSSWPVEELEKTLLREGYFQIDSGLPSEVVKGLAQAVATLTDNACPSVFLGVYDQFWSLVAMLSPVLRQVLGDGYRQLPDFWAWHIDPTTEGTGWRPHRDKGFGSLFPGGRPKSLTIWVPLTDATTLNGCIYIVPANLDPPSRYVDREDKRMPENLQDIRALPIKAGGVLGWNQAVLHWGGRSNRRAAGPRISFACEFQRGDVPPYNQPLLDPINPPSFEHRLSLIGKQILQYRHMYNLSDGLAAVAQHMVSLRDDWKP